MDTTLKYANEFTPPSDDHIARWTAVVRPGQRLPTLSGSCPKCEHPCEIAFADIVVQGGMPAAAKSETPTTVTRQVVCNCTMDHAQPPGVRAGCGRYWLGTTTKQQDGSYKIAAEKNLSLLPAAVAFNDALKTQNARIQLAAEKWLGAVTAIYGLFSLVGIATARDALAGMEWWGKLLVAVVLLGGVGSAGSAIILGYLAAYGWPRVTQVDDLEEWHNQSRGYAETAASNLKKAIVCAFISLAAVAIVMLLVWFLPRK